MCGITTFYITVTLALSQSKHEHPACANLICSPMFPSKPQRHPVPECPLVSMLVIQVSYGKEGQPDARVRPKAPAAAERWHDRAFLGSPLERLPPHVLVLWPPLRLRMLAVAGVMRRGSINNCLPGVLVDQDVGARFLDGGDVVVFCVSKTCR